MGSSRERLLQQRRSRRTAPAASTFDPQPEAPPRARHRRRAPAPQVPSPVGLVSSPSRVWSAAMLVAVAATAAHLALSDRYVVATPIVVGNHRVPTGVVRTAAAVEGQRLFSLDVQAAEARVEALPDVAKAVVAARLPNHVWINLEETRPALRWSTPSGVAVIDEDGHVVTGAVDTSDLVRVADETGIVTRPGDTVAPELVAAALAYGPHFPELRYRQATGFVGVGADGVEVRLGSDAEAVGRQLTLLAAIEPELASVGSAVAFVDLRFERPFYRLRGVRLRRE